MSVDMHGSQNLKRSHAAIDDASDDDHEPISEAALESSAFYTKGLDVMPFSTIRRLKEVTDMLSKRLAAGETEKQYYAFSGVLREVFDTIDRDRSLLGHCVQITYFWHERVMIVKLPSVLHELGHVEFGKELTHELTLMGVPIHNFVGTGSGKMVGRDSSKEGDSSFKPRRVRRRENDWPTIVVEAGYSPNLRSLRNAARWWLYNSNDDVKIVILISICARTKQLIVEKWCNIPVIPRRSNRCQQGPGALLILPGLVTSITVSHIPNTQLDLPTSYNVVGPSLTLEFARLFLRAPIPPEHDVSLGHQELQSWAMAVWDSAQ